MQCLAGQYFLQEGVEASQQLIKLNLLVAGTKLKLHLGCGENHLNGYINIDYPATEHTVQTKTGADIFGDITKICFQPSTVDEIRLHHVFEHFDRPTAIALLCAWHMWLKSDGILYIEVPDFLTSAKMILDGNYTYLQKQIILRHIFGSHEASWAIHCDGWYKEKFEHILALLGFKDIKIGLSSWSVIHNVTVHAQKSRELSLQELQKIGRQILAESLVNASEQKMFEVWCQKFDAKFKKLVMSDF
jgi:predicted SAM-dependent methyltransferase